MPFFPPRVAQSSDRSRRYEAASVTGLLIGLTMVAVLSCAMVVGFLIWRADDDANRHASSIVAGAVDRERARISNVVFVNAHWNEAADHVYGTPDGRWLQSNYGTPSASSFVLEADGHTLFSHLPGPHAPPLDRMVSAATFRALLALVPSTEAAARRLHAAPTLVARFNAVPALLSVMPIVREGGPIRLDRRSFRILVNVAVLDQELLTAWAGSFRLPGLRWAAPGLTPSPFKAVIDWQGRPMATLTWQPLTPGGKAFKAILPLIAACVVLFLALSTLLIRRVARLNRALGLKSRRAAAAAAKEEAARRTAEQALDEARRARAQTEAEAQRRIAAEEQHRADLRAASAQLADRLQATIGAIIARLRLSATELDRSATDALATADVQRRQAQTAHALSDRTAAATCTLLDTMRGLAATVEQVGVEARRSARMTIEAASHSASVQRANEALVGSVSAIEQAADRIASLSRATNLLALNATLEAARAGEAGRGFAVVAQEVKNFSRQTAGTTGEIAGQVRDMSSATSSAVERSDALRAAIEALAGSARQTIDMTARQGGTGAEIQDMIVAIEGNTSTARIAIAAMADAFAATAAAADHTRQVSADMRHHTEALQGECERILLMLRAA
jgi:methyl-accepting chemotaxis protein